MIVKIRRNARSFTGEYAFLANYTYNLGADRLTTFGQQEMVHSGINYYERYKDLTQDLTPFMRSSGEGRVLQSAQKWMQGFHEAKMSDGKAKKDFGYPYDIFVVGEDTGSNNTLNHGLCNRFENGRDSLIASAAQTEWTNIFVPPVQARVNTMLPGANLTQADIISLMDLCPFSTVASPVGKISQFCSLFTQKEWQQYDYYETLNKYYGYSYGNPLGPTQGVGFANELVARLTSTPVHDHTSTNRTMDSSNTTFALERKL
ncbi:hypothetical protein LTR16_008531, partial [Cryomyces antarcticus]